MTFARMVIFWWQRRRAGFPVKFGTRSSGIHTYSQFAYFLEEER